MADGSGGRKGVKFIGDSLEVLRSFPDEARNECGHQIDRVQQGLNPDNFLARSDIGSGCYEIRVQESDSWFRVFYVAKWADHVYVLHAIQKKSNKTTKNDNVVASRRYKEAKQIVEAK
ncbi:type II toxin-antitoxin system RelE/ParE family toxin [Rhodococcus sp. BUPNP1]|uniref:type II toxin-antitoxin system RelE/ParE family toxin n=1 Tax=Rhodococcus sp. BUPNP1 TaxID=1432786 RepID=UPI000B5A7519|nr:type II toxin-antitoxin system RelE/ParE family toxin [Rhodococcus sp. BUPNP1]OWY79158.1 hypothetical protein B9C99_24230 [Rhodococcus sp. BUPNP1]